MKNVWDQIGRAQEDFETDSYKVIGVQYKFNPNLSRKHKFEKCRANMLTATWAADDKVYMCTDSRENEWAYPGDHHPDPQKFIESWGNAEHFEKINNINFDKDCDRCTLVPYNEMFEQVFMRDKIDRNLI